MAPLKENEEKEGAREEGRHFSAADLSSHAETSDVCSVPQTEKREGRKGGGGQGYDSQQSL